MTSAVNNPPPVPGPDHTAAVAAPSYATAAGVAAKDPKAPGQGPAIATSAGPAAQQQAPPPAVVVGHSGPPSGQNADVAYPAPVNGKTVGPMAMYGRTGSMNGGIDHTKNPVTMAAPGPNSYTGNGPPVPGPLAASHIQFGFVESPAMPANTPQRPDSMVSIPSLNPSPIPQPSRSGGPVVRPAQADNQMLAFGSMGPHGGDADHPPQQHPQHQQHAQVQHPQHPQQQHQQQQHAQQQHQQQQQRAMRPAFTPNQTAASLVPHGPHGGMQVGAMQPGGGGMPRDHMGPGDMGNVGMAGAGRGGGGFGRGRSFSSNNNPNNSNSGQYVHYGGSNYRGQGRNNMQPNYGPSRGPFAPPPNRSPAMASMAPAMPGTPNMGQANLMSMSPSPAFHYPPPVPHHHVPPPAQQVLPPLFDSVDPVSTTNSTNTSQARNKKGRHDADKVSRQEATPLPLASSSAAPASSSQDWRQPRHQPDSHWKGDGGPNLDQAAAPAGGNSAYSAASTPAVHHAAAAARPVLAAPFVMRDPLMPNLPLDLSPASGQFDRLLMNIKQQNMGYPPHPYMQQNYYPPPMYGPTPQYQHHQPQQHQAYHQQPPGPPPPFQQQQQAPQQALPQPGHAMSRQSSHSERPTSSASNAHQSGQLMQMQLQQQQMQQQQQLQQQHQQQHQQQPVIVSSIPQQQSISSMPPPSMPPPSTPTISTNFVRPKRTAAIPIKNSQGVILDVSNVIKTPSSPAPGSLLQSQSKTPPVSGPAAAGPAPAAAPVGPGAAAPELSTPTTQSSTPSHGKSESKTRTTKEIQDELREKVMLVAKDKSKQDVATPITPAQTPDLAAEPKPEPAHDDAGDNAGADADPPKVETAATGEEAKPESPKPEEAPAASSASAAPAAPAATQPPASPAATTPVPTSAVPATAAPQHGTATPQPVESPDEDKTPPAAATAATAATPAVEPAAPSAPETTPVPATKQDEDEKVATPQPAAAEPDKVASEPQEAEDEIERMIREMEELEAAREKAEAEHREKAKAEKEAAKQQDEANKKTKAEDNDRLLREMERQMEREEDEKLRRASEPSGQAVSVASALAQARVGASLSLPDPPPQPAETPKVTAANVGEKLGSLRTGTDPKPSLALPAMPPPPQPAASVEGPRAGVPQRAKPAALTLKPVGVGTVEPPQPSAALQSLKSARFLTVLDQDIYPPGIHSPNPALNAAVAKKGKTFKYDANFLLQFQKVFTEQPSMEFGQQVKTLIGESEGRIGSGSSSSRAPLPGGGGIGGGGGGSGRSNSRGGGGFQPMGAFGALGSGRGGAPVPSGMGGMGGMSGMGGGGMGGIVGMGGIGGIGSGPPPPHHLGGRPPAIGAGGPVGSFASGRPPFGGASMSRSASQQNIPGSAGLLHSPSGRQSSRQGTRNNNNKGGRGAEQDSRKMMPLTQGQDIKPLLTSGVGWKPLSIGNKAAQAPTAVVDQGGYLDPQMVQRKVKAALNKMTPEKFDKIADQILHIAAQSKDESDGRTLRQVIQLTFEKAVDESYWASMYAKFCRRMLDMMNPEIRDERITDKSGSVVSGGALFRKYLLNRCQEDFERGWSVNLPDKPQEGSDGGEKSGGGEAAAMLSEEYYIAAAAKRRGLGLVQFIGELFKLGMLTERIMHECVQKLVDFNGVPDEAEVESLSKLLRTIGMNLDNSDKSRSLMDVYFGRIQTMLDVPDLPSRMRYMLMDVMDLRRSGWVSKETNKGPKTLEEVRADAEAAQAQKAQEAARSNQRGGMPSGRPPMGRQDARQLSGQLPQPTNNQLNPDELRRLKGSVSRSSTQAGFGPMHMFSSRSNSGRRLGPPGQLSRHGEESGVSSRTATPPGASTQSNAFSLLAMDPENPGSPPSVNASPALPKASLDRSTGNTEKDA